MNTKIQNGSFLISTPDINYDIFFKSIIFISNIENQEIIGFIINKKTKFFVHDFIICKFYCKRKTVNYYV